MSGSSESSWTGEAPGQTSISYPAHQPAYSEQNVPQEQDALLLHGPRQQYKIHRNYPVPQLADDNEVLVKAVVIGLNPIDWKAP